MARNTFEAGKEYVRRDGKVVVETYSCIYTSQSEFSDGRMRNRFGAGPTGPHKHDILRPATEQDASRERVYSARD